MSSLWVYSVLFLLTAGESAAFLGLVVPGEAAVLGAGALASRGEVALLPAIAVTVAGAVLGDTIGYALGKRFGHGRQSGPLARVWSCQRMLRVRGFLDRHGRKTIFLARFVGFFRALAPFAAGAVRMPYRPFLLYNVAGALVWGTATVLAGYFAGEAAIRRLESATLVVVAITAAALIAAFLLRHWLNTRRMASEQNAAEVL
jgi:membrane protein DedA with SNARE-associated domain